MSFGGLLGSLYGNVPEPKATPNPENFVVNPVQAALLSRNRRAQKKAPTAVVPQPASVPAVAEQLLTTTDSADVTAQLLPLVNEYDPSIPNNYNEIMKKKKHEQECQKAKVIQEEINRLREEQLKASVTQPLTIPLDITGEEAYSRRKFIVATTITPSVPVVPTVTMKAPESSVFEEVSTASGDASSRKSYAQKILEKMGWKEGEGLGREKQGIVAPLVARKTDTRSGVIVEGGKKPKKQSMQQESLKQTATRILMLTNMVTRGQVDEDLEAETTEEAAKFGNLLSINIKDIKSLPDESAIRIFLEYESSDEAIKAYHNFHNRVFDGRVVKVFFYNEDLYAAGTLESI